MSFALVWVEAMYGQGPSSGTISYPSCPYCKKWYRFGDLVYVILGDYYRSVIVVSHKVCFDEAWLLYA